MFDNELAQQQRRIQRLEDTLRTIADWRADQLPRIPYSDDPTKTMSYGAAYGSNGERDYFRKLALEALNAR